MLCYQSKADLTDRVVLSVKGSVFHLMKYIILYITYISPEGSPIYSNQLDNTGIRYNNFGRILVDLCCTYNIHILNGRCSNDSDGNYTCIANEGHSLVDYHLASSELFPFIPYFNVEMRDESDLLSH